MDKHDSTSRKMEACIISTMNRLSKNHCFAVAFLVATLAACLYAFSSGFLHMVAKWSKDEYSHAYLIPAVALFLMYQKLPVLSGLTPHQRWAGPILVLFSVMLLVLGEISSLFMIIQYGFLLAIAGVLVSNIGLNGGKIISIGLVYLVFMIPLPNFLYNNLSNELQLISSQLGVTVVRLFGISVFLEGNVIDLGAMKLQVVEACSGLRYLFPLMSFGFLVAVLYRAPIWQRAIVFLSTIPITVLMNSFRISVIGITVEYWGIGAAEGFLHDFEGWIVFMACLFVLFVEIWLLHVLFNRSETHILDRIDVSIPEPAIDKSYLNAAGIAGWPVVTSIVLLAVAGTSVRAIDQRVESAPERIPLTSFPLVHKSWFGREKAMSEEAASTLAFTDYILADYTHKSKPRPVNLYAAYYGSQRKGASIHSPRSCIPGGGWQISDFRQKHINSVPVNSAAGLLRVNRVLIEKGEAKMLVYYWFEQRGRIITNEFLAKWYIFWDAIFKNRTDGALIRLTTVVGNSTEIEKAEEDLIEFIEDFYPSFSRYIPGESAGG